MVKVLERKLVAKDRHQQAQKAQEERSKVLEERRRFLDKQKAEAEQVGQDEPQGKMTAKQLREALEAIGFDAPKNWSKPQLAEYLADLQAVEAAKAELAELNVTVDEGWDRETVFLVLERRKKPVEELAVDEALEEAVALGLNLPENADREALNAAIAEARG